MILVKSQCISKLTNFKNLSPFQFYFSVGGKVDGGNSGIFIKNVIDSSPAGRSAGLFTGDRILEVAGVSLTSSEQNVAVEAIKSSTSPIQFVVQSLQPAKVCHFVSNSKVKVDKGLGTL